MKPVEWPIEVDVSIYDRPEVDYQELANITVGYGQSIVTIYIHRAAPEMLAKSLALSILHEMTHWILASANEDYWSEKFAVYGEDILFSWLYGQDVLDRLDDCIQKHNKR